MPTATAECPGCWMCTGPVFDDEPVRAEPQPAPAQPLLRLIVDNTR